MKKVYSEVSTICKLILESFTAQIFAARSKPVPVLVRSRYMALIVMMLIASAANAAVPTITLTSQEIMWVDANKCNSQGPRGAWMSFVVTNPNTTTMTGVTVTFSGFTGTNASYFVAPHDVTRTFSSIAPGQSVPVFYYVDYSDICNHPHGGGDVYAGYTANYAITVTSSAGTATRNGTIQTKELLTTSAGGHAISSVLSTSNVSVGQTFTQTITYSFGNNTDLFFQPNCEMDFPDGCLRLVKDTVSATSPSVTGILGQSNALAFPDADVPSTGNTITIIYTWQVLCLDYPATLHPWAAAKSGNKYKYQDGFEATSTVCFTPTISYAGGPFCPAGIATVTRNGAAGGTYSSTSGLSINASTGAINLASSTPGTYTVTYTLAAGCSGTTVVTVSAAPAITGVTSVCAGNNTTLSHAVAGGTWTSVNTSVATISASGVVTGVSAGTSQITYTTPAGCFATAIVTVNAAPSSIGGIARACVGGTTTLTNTLAGGTWSSSTTGVATINASGVVSGANAGTTTISYSVPGGCLRTVVATVNALPSVSGTPSMCEGSSVSLSGSPAGGTWSSEDPAEATVSATGVVSGVTAGTTTIIYTALTGCSRSVVATVNTTPSAIGGSGSICLNASTTMSNAVPGGTWSSSNFSVASIGVASGVITGTGVGTSIITYSLGACKATSVFTVMALPATITGTTKACPGTTTTLASSSAGGTWSSSNTSVATISETTGVVTGSAVGTTTISYTNASGCVRSAIVTINAIPTAITGTAVVCEDATTTLSGAAGSATWTSGNTAIANVNALGVVTGILAGTANITYTTTTTGCYTSAVVTVNARPTAISGTRTVCTGLATTLGSTPEAGTWSAANCGIATVAGGIVNGVNAGVTNITYTIGNGCRRITPVTVNQSPAAITGACQLCVGTVTSLSNTGSGTWSSSNTAVATVPVGVGGVTGVAVGTSTITFTVASGCITTKQVTVNPSPSAISGPTSTCAGSTVTLGNTVPGGSWSTNSAAVLNVNAETGVITANTAGVVTVSYAFGTGCRVTTLFTANALPAAITGTLTTCTGAQTSLSITSGAGTWSSCNNAVATTNATGLISGVAPGTAAIRYTLPNGCFRSAIVTVSATPMAISGPSDIYEGTTAAMTNSVTGGSWSSSNVGVATVDAGTGTVSGMAEGSAVITYVTGPGCYVTKVISVNAMPGITGGGEACVGANISLSNIVAGGMWSSSNNAVATVNAEGVVTGVTAGTAIISYIVSTGSYRTTVVTINGLPEITGASSVCLGASRTLSANITGGNWSSSNSDIVSIGEGSGVISGVSAGTVLVTYTTASGCRSTISVVTNVLPPAIEGAATVCVGSTIGLTNTAEGGTWSSANSGIATVDATTGVVTGVAAGSTLISYTSTAGCSVSKVVTVNPLPYPGTISGPSAVCAGTTIHLIDTVTGGTWTSGDTTIATTCPCNSGHVTGVAYGTVVMTYSVTNMCGTASISHAVVVNTVPAVTPSLINPVLTGATSASMSFTTTGSASAYSLTWNDAAKAAGFNDVTAVALTSSPLSIAVPSTATPATYTGTLTVTNGSCTSSAQVIGITVNPSINIYTFAGNGTFGYTVDNNASTATSISHPYHIATDCNGNTYYADYDNSIVRKISATGIVTTVAGSGVVGFTGNGGPATAARLSHPTGVAVDAAGNLYISDYNNMVVRKVNTAGIISNFAGNGANGYTGDGGAATAAKLSYPSGIAIDAAGNVYIADYMNTAIRRVNTSGVISTVAGNGIVGYTGDGGAATAARLANPRGVAVDAVGNIYIADYGNNVIRKVNTAGTISTMAGNTIPGYSGDGGAATAAKLRNPYGISLDGEGNVYFTELQNNIVRKVNTSGVISTIAGNASQGYSGDLGPAVLARLNQPMGIAVNCAGKILISDYGNYVIRVLGSINRVPFFVASGTQSVQACQNTTLSLNSILAVKDFDTTQTMTWTVTSAPAHGTLVAGYTTSSTGSLLTPSGLSYTPTTGYTGTDVFTVQVSDGIASATTTVALDISAPANAGAITGPSSVCGLATVALGNAATGGTWSSSNTAIATVNAAGAVTGTGYGSTTISYTVTNGCGTATATRSFTVNPLAVAGNVVGAANVCVGSSLIYYDTVLGGTWSVGNTSIATVTTTGDGICSVYGVSQGLTTVTYTVSNSCGIAYAFRDVTVQLMPTVAAITGSEGVCSGSVLALADSTPYGAWYSSNPTVANVNIVTGMVTGLTAGNTTISYAVHNACGVVTVTKDITVNSSTYTVSEISGASSVCVAATTSLANATTGGTWSSSNVTKATVGSLTGVVTGIAAGTAVITYTVTNSCGASIATKLISVNPLPVAGTISNGGSVCVNANRTLTASVSGGVWSSSNTARSVVNSSGVVTGMGAGASIISYGVTNGCGTAYATTNVPVDPLPTAGTISGSSTVCFSNITTLASTVAGGSWSSSNTAIASITTSGVVLGNGAGTVTISYTTHNGCGYAYTSRVQTVNPLPYVAAISGPSAVNMGATIALTDSAAGGVWSSSNTALATVGSTGTVTGVTPGTVTISYAVTNSCGTAYATKEINVLVLSAYIVHSNVTTAGGNDGCALLFVSGGVSPYTYQWSNGVTTMNNTWLMAGSYSVLVTDANGDTTSARVTITQPGSGARMFTSGGTTADSTTTETLSVTEVLQAQGMTLSAYPNPFQSVTTIRFVLPESSNNAALDIYEAATGRKVRTLFSDKVKGGEEYSGYFNADDLAPGIYIYKLSTENSTFYGKLILNR